MLCPRCQHEQPDAGEECSACGVVFSTFQPRPLTRSRPVPPEAVAAPWRRGLTWLAARMFQTEPSENRALVAVRAVFLLILGIWWLRLLAVPYQGEALAASILHLIHLPFHEAGHFVFQPFGEFLHILGGTLGQLLVPVIVSCAFLREQNPFGAAVGTWWLGQSFMDCAPYINDARERTLMLLSGETGQEDWEGHDWYQLLSRTGNLSHDHALARCSWLLGAALMLAALGWGAYLLWRQLQPVSAQDPAQVR